MKTTENGWHDMMMYAKKRNEPNKVFPHFIRLLNIITRQGGVRMSRCGQYGDSASNFNTQFSCGGSL